ncbi:M28 family metallopeptidase [Hyphococcus flavus]|uniref:M28 family metallopeptidase n=1 Tax=Hyphococcus flavus TaxID=1866326 RepID=A0AAE9ZBF2_9PROT|nr:M28 family metallopeptidase [Hyphococcus flavus]WDI31523.1 M28 family metallopeptidase [Hyphococcus flavus]
MHMRQLALTAAIFTLVLTACGKSENTDADAPAETLRSTSKEETSSTLNLEPIDQAKLRQRIAALSSDEFEGRAPATPGGAKTREWLVNQMKEIGLQPGSGDSYEQVVPLVELTLQMDQSNLTINGEELAQGSEAVYWTKRVQEEVSFTESDLVFVGYGVVAPEYNWNDYEGIDVTGKTVVILVNDPGYATGDPDLFNGNAMTYYGRWTYKFEEAGRQGAAAALVVHQTAPAAYGWNVVEGSWTGAQLDLERPDGGANRTALEGWIQESVARDLFDKAGMNFDDAVEAAKSRGFTAMPMGDLKSSGVINSTIRRSESANVVGVVPGSEHPEEYVLYMAHWDHLGVNPNAEGDQVANGAVDNATGTAAILSIAEAFLQSENPTERSVIVAAVTAEESGLLGSAYMAEDPVVPFNQIVGGINIDAILPLPPTKDLMVVGYGASELEDILENVAEKRGMYLRPDPEPEKGYFYRSDHISLAKKGVPMLYADAGIDLLDGGEGAGSAFSDDYRVNRYHQPSDEYSADWNMDGMTNVVSVLYEVGADMAYSDKWPNWYQGNEFRALRDEQRAIDQ